MRLKPRHLMIIIIINEARTSSEYEARASSKYEARAYSLIIMRLKPLSINDEARASIIFMINLNIEAQASIIVNNYKI